MVKTKYNSVSKVRESSKHFSVNSFSPKVQ